VSDVNVSTREGATVATFDAPLLSIITFPKSGRTVWPSRASEALQADPSVVAVIDGPMFNNCDSRPYATSSCADMDYLHVDAAKQINYQADSDKRGRGITLSVMPDGSTRWALGASPESGAKTSVQFYPSLVYNGQVQSVSNSGSNANRVWRAGVAQLSDGKLAFVVAQESLSGFAALLRRLGAVHAGYTDGGGSTAVATRERTVGSSENRPVATWLAVRARGSAAPSTSPPAPPAHHGATPAPAPPALTIPPMSVAAIKSSKVFPVVMGVLVLGTAAFVVSRLSKD
jgi:hypothetical protein